MVNGKDFQKAVELINKSENILLTTHTRPDGDACGCIAAMCSGLAALGKKAQPIMLSEIPGWYQFLFAEQLQIYDENMHIETDLIIIVDTNSNSQLPKFDRYLKQNDKPVLIIDHHVTSDGLGDVELIDTSAAATALIVFDLFKYADWPITTEIAKALFVAVSTDTGWFHFENTDSRVYKVCSELIDIGVHPARIYHDLYQNFSYQRFKLMIVMLNTIRLHLKGRFATQHLLWTDFEHTGATYQDTENLIDQCQLMDTVETAALFVELKDGRVKCSLRSSGRIDVRKIAQKFGGGGHTMASGVHLPGPLKNAKQLILEQIKEQFEQLDSE